MNIILKTFEHKEKGFKVKVTTCNKRVATTEDLEDGKIVKFNRGKFEWMISKGVFCEVSSDE